MGNSESTQLTILHFNDVYNIEPRDQEPVGGAARFHTAVKERLALNPLILFSGDVFNPSLMSAVTKGKQMVPILNAIGVHCAVVGNHDFDFGVDTLVQMSSQTSFPWLMGNVFDNETDAPLADCLMSHIIVWQGKKMGLIGLVEEEWIDTLSTIDPDDITYVDYVQQGKMLCKQLKEDGVDYIIALTHMRWPNDIRLAQEVEDIDLILGGHDHDYVIDKINGKYIIKSGTDFRQMSQITLTFENKKVDVKVEEVTIDSSVKQDEDIAKVVNDYLDIMGEEMEQVLGHMEVEMDGRFASLRNKETNLGNFITNIMLECTDAEVAILNSGTLRSDTIHPRGPFKVKDLLSILPLIDPLVVIKVKGQQILDALENGVSQYPKLEGRFPQVAGIMFGFDPNLPTGQRLIRDKVKVQGESVELEREYRVCTKHYLAEGKDGYDMFKDCAMLVNDEEGPRLSVVVQNHFNSVKLLKGEEKSKFQHRQSLIAVNR
ncbi:hypothetical protein CAPTEDRAFT_120927 [Capitella teleta]|uniref:5'-Nucleotidase C-terminal domain-containing protein n=1 Tax=Capitella teleta TaxID=283909 RepID=R7TTC5_CAPTE|nr:hypothetical protein CAPTEDRAFT_120927 [Capitella teleta]|eukprot:ELT96847.1 hypothetical protein CAPTEDRAFT_120927 [Capitella teleta]